MGTTAVGTAVLVGMGVEVDATAVGMAVYVGSGVGVNMTVVGTAVCVGMGVEMDATVVGMAVYVGSGVGVDATPIMPSVCGCAPLCAPPQAAKINQIIAAVCAMEDVLEVANSVDDFRFKIDLIDLVVRANTQTRGLCRGAGGNSTL